MPFLLSRLCLAGLLCISSGTARAEKLLILGDDNYRPVIYLDEQKQPAGLLVDVLNNFQEESGEQIQIKLYPWKRAFVSAEKGLGGVIGVSKTEARLQQFDYSAPIYDDNINIVVLKGHEFAFNTLSDLSDRKIGVQLGASYGSEVDAAIHSGSILAETDANHFSRLKKLLYGRIDAAFVGNGRFGLQVLLASDPQLAKHQDDFVILEKPLVHDQLYLAFAKSMHQQDFLERFNTVLLDYQTEQKLLGLADANAQH